MSISPVIQAPWPVQVYRCFFIVCLFYFGSYLRLLHHGSPLSGVLVLSSFPFCSLLGLLATCIRVPIQRWVLSVFGILIPVVVSLAIFFMLSHREWLDWLFAPIYFFLWLAMPVCGTIVLFKDKKTYEYFARSAA